jgi:serine/threonine protein kinase
VMVGRADNSSRQFLCRGMGANDVTACGFTLGARLGFGLHAEVFRAEAPHRRPVACRVLRRYWCTDSGARASFDAGFITLRTTPHRNIVPVIRLTTVGDRPAMLLPLAKGDLASWLHANPVDVSNERYSLKELAGDLRDGVTAFHRAGLAHGDVRAENVLVFSDPYRAVGVRLCFTDPGCPKAVSGAISHSQVADLVGLVQLIKRLTPEVAKDR